MRTAKQMQFCGAVARALLIGVKFGELNGVRIGSGLKMKKNLKYPLAGEERFLVKYGCKAK